MTVSTATVSDTALDEIRHALRDAQETLRAIRSGEIDALIVHTADGDQLFTLTGADRPYRRFVEAMAEAGLVVSSGGTILSGNPRLAELTGLPVDSLIGTQLSELVSDESRHSLQSLLDGDPATVSAPVELTVLTHGGDVPVIATAGRLDLGNGVDVDVDVDAAFCVLLTDISERKRAEQTQRFQAQLLEAAGEAIIVTDAEGLVIFANRAAEVLYGWTTGELLGRHVTDTTPSDASVQQSLQIMDRLLAGETWAGEFMVRRKDGTEFPAFVHDTPVFDDSGALRAVIGISTDITERKADFARLAAREQWFRIVVASSSDFIIVLDAEGTIIFANAATARFLGFDPTANDGCNASDLVHPGNLDDALARFASVTSAPLTQQQVIIRVKDANDAWRFIDADLTNCLEDPAINGVVVNARDVTDNRRLSRALSAVSRVNEIIIHAADETTLLGDACLALVEFGDYSLAWVGRADHDAGAVIHAVAAAGDRRVLDETVISAADTELGRGITGTAIRSRCPQVLNSFAGSRFEPWRETISNHDLASGCAFPLEIGGEVWSLSIYATEENAFDAAAVAVFEQLASDIVFGINQLRGATRLAQSEMHLREAERLAHVGHWAWNLDTDRFELLATEAFAIHGIAPANWGHTYQAFLALVHPDDRGSVEDAFATAKESGSVELRHRIVRPDGEVRHVIKRAEAVRDGDGRVVRILGATMDVTEMVMMDAANTEARQYLTAITDNMAEGMIALDTDNTVTFVNEAGCRMLGWTQSALVGLPGHETFHSRNADGSAHPFDECPLARVAALQEPCRVDQDTFIRRDGTLLPVEYSASPFTTDHAPGTVVVFNDITDRLAAHARMQQQLDKLAWVGRVRDALDQDRFVLYLQPITDLHSGETTRHELLIRMVGVDGAIIPPDRFIPAAEEYGLIAEIDHWVVKDAARIAALGIPVTFNLSSKSVVDPHMVSFITETLKSAGASPENVVCEITETGLMTDTTAGEAFVRGLRDIGCGVALDDFGVGYGGFSYLKRLPITTLKIDREFIADVVRETSSKNVVAAVVSLARAFSAKTVAEGAEDMETVEILKDLGVDYVQGYVFGHPVPLDEAFDRRGVPRSRTDHFTRS